MKNKKLYTHNNSSASQGKNADNLIFKKSAQLLPLIIGIFLLTFCTFAAQKALHLNTNYSLDQFFPEQHKLLDQSQQIRRTFSLDESSAFFVILEIPKASKSTTTSWLTKPKMNELAKITADLQNTKGIKSVVSLANIEGATQNKNDFVVGPIFKSLPASQWKSYTENSPLIRSQLISSDLNTVIILAEPEKLSPDALNLLSKKITATVAKYSPASKLQIGGVPAIQAQFSKQLFGELKIYLSASVIGFGLMFFAFLGGYTSIALAFIALFAGNVLSLGLLSYLQVPFSVLLTTLPIVLSIAILSVLIHTMHRWAEVIQSLEYKPNYFQRFVLSVQTLKEMFLSNLLGSLTTAIGFFALYFTEIPLIKQYGWVVSLFVILGWVFAQILLVAFMPLTTPQLRQWTLKKSTWLLPVFENRTKILCSVMTAFAVCMFLAKDLRFSSRLFDDLPKNDPVYQATQLIDRKMGGAVGYDVTLNSVTDDFWKTKTNLVKLNQSLIQIRKIAGVGSAISYSDFFTKPKQLTQQKIAEEFFLFTLAEKNPLKNFVTDSGKSARIAIRLNDLPTNEIANIRRKVISHLALDFKKVDAIESGIAVTSHSINQSVSKDLVFNFWHALVLVSALLVFVFRSLRWALVACLPNLLPPAILIGVMAAAGTPIKPGVALIFSIALGLAFNNTVYVLVRLQKIMKEKGLQGIPIKRAMLQEGNPCLFETCIMLVGFSFFIMSDFGANRIFGIYMVLSIIAGAIGDILFLPALISKFPGLLKPLNKRTEIRFPKADIQSEYKTATKQMAASIAFLFVFCAALSGTPIGFAQASANKTVESVLKEVQNRVTAKDDEAEVKMKIIEANGEVKQRVLLIKMLNIQKSGKFHALVRLQAPADIKGMAFLAIVDKESESQWLYLPSAKQVRRLVGTQKSAGVLGSELSIDDLNSTAIKTAKTRIIKQDKKEILIEVLPKKGTSTYAKAITTISATQFVPLKTEYFEKNGKLKKRVVFANYKKIKGFWRAHSIKVENLLNNRKTDLELSQIKVNSGFSKDEFTQNSLKP